MDYIHKIIPNYSEPGFEWAEKVAAVFKAAKVDLAACSGDEADKILAMLLSKLPASVIKCLPLGEALTVVFDFLRKYDAPRDSLTAVLQARTGKEYRPSIAFRLTKAQLLYTMPKDTPQDVVEQLAWETIRKGFPEMLQKALILKPDMPTKDEKWAHLDDAWMQETNGEMQTAAVSSKSDQASCNVTNEYG